MFHKTLICVIGALLPVIALAQSATFIPYTLEEVLANNPQVRVYEGVYNDPHPTFSGWNMEKARVVEKADIKITYDATILIDSLSSEKSKDGVLVLIGKDHIYSIGQSLEHLSSTRDLLPGRETILNWAVLRSLKEKSVNNSHIPPLKRNYAIEYSESQPVFTWELIDSTKTFLGYECQMAMADYAGRTWTVWFTPEIAVDCALWKFSGLPGLIVKAYDNLGFYDFEISNMEKTSDSIIVPTKIQSKMLDRDAFRKAEALFYKTPVVNGNYPNQYMIGIPNELSRISTLSAETIRNSLTTIYTPYNYSINYYPMELE